MSLDELKERIKDEVVLREGDLFEWQWQQLGLLADADALGISATEFLTLVNDVSRAVNPYVGRISDLKVNVADMARLARKKLTNGQINQIVADAERLRLQPDFVKTRWIPTILATLPEPVDAPDEPTLVVVPVVEPINPQPVPPVVSQPARVNGSSAAAIPASGIDREAVLRKVHQFLDDYVADKLIPIHVLKPLFLATTFDETVLADAVLAYLSANFYAAETPVQGESLKAKLLSTDWRHLSWWASKPAGPAASVAAVSPGQVQPRRSSDSGVIGMALVVVGLLVGSVWWVTGRTTEPAKITPTKIQPADTTPTTPLKKKSRRKSRVGQH